MEAVATLESSLEELWNCVAVHQVGVVETAHDVSLGLILNKYNCIVAFSLSVAVCYSGCVPPFRCVAPESCGV